jgi:hypothetical protein
MPSLFRWIPSKSRMDIVKSHLGPAGGWFMKDRLARVPVWLGWRIQRARASNSKIQLDFVGPDGGTRQVSTEHVIAATGFRVDLSKLTFLGSEIKMGLKSVGSAPSLSPYFQSSVPGLYFVGATSANTFGPVMRFAAGAEYTSQRIARHFSAECDTAQ